MENLTFQKMFARATKGKFLSWYNQNMREGEVFRLITVRTEKQVSGVHKY